MTSLAWWVRFHAPDPYVPETVDAPVRAHPLPSTRTESTEASGLPGECWQGITGLWLSDPCGSRLLDPVAARLWSKKRLGEAA